MSREIIKILVKDYYLDPEINLIQNVSDAIKAVARVTPHDIKVKAGDTVTITISRDLNDEKMQENS